MSKATKKDMYMREVDIQAMMAQGVAPKTMFEELGKKWEVSPRTIETQYYKIVDAIAKSVEEGRNELRAVLLARQDHIYRKALSEGAYKIALDTTLAQAKLTGLNDSVQKDTKQPEIIEIFESDYSGKLKVVGESNGTE